MTNVNQLGGKLGPRIADITSRAYAITKEKTAATTHNTALNVVGSIFRQINAEQRDAVGDLLAKTLGHNEAPEWAQRINDIIQNGTGQWGELLANTAISTGVASSLTGVIVNEIAPVTLRIIEENPNLPLDPTSAAKLNVQGIMSYDAASVEAARGGINIDRFGKVVEGLYQVPGLGELLQLVNRGDIDIGLAAQALQRQGVWPELRGQLMELRHYVQSPADLALGVLKGVIDHGAAVDEGTKSGLSGDQMGFLEDITGEPPGIQELLFAYRRNIINRDRLVHGIRQSRLRVEWTDVIESLRYLPMSAADAVQAAVQNHLSATDAKRIVAENGTDPQYYEVLYETAGNPPGPMEMLDLLNRGEMSEADVKQGLRESRLKNKYIDTEILLRRQLLTSGQVNLALAQGIMSPAEGINHYMDQGYEHQDAATLVASASISRQARQYELTQVQIETLYLDRAITRADAKKQIEGLGYSEQEAELILLTKDLEREHRFFEAAINRVHASYVGHKLDDTQAKGQLDALKLAAEQEADLLALWSIEKTTNVSILTVAQIQAALKRGLIDQTAALDRFAALGYAEDDATILLELVVGLPGG